MQKKKSTAPLAIHGTTAAVTHVKGGEAGGFGNIHRISSAIGLENEVAVESVAFGLAPSIAVIAKRSHVHVYGDLKKESIIKKFRPPGVADAVETGDERLLH